MISYTFKSQVSGIEALKAIVGKRYSYILDTINYLYREYQYDERRALTVDVWKGTSGTIAIDITLVYTCEAMVQTSKAIVTIARYGKTLEVRRHTVYTDEHVKPAITTYLDIEIPKKTKFEKVLLRCM